MKRIAQPARLPTPSTLLQLAYHIGLAASYIHVGQEEEAHAEAAEVLKIDPEFSLERYAKTYPLKNKADLDLHVGALRKAGLK